MGLDQDRGLGGVARYRRDALLAQLLDALAVLFGDAAMVDLLFETLRRNQATAKTPILFMSAVATADHMLREVADPKFSRFMPKPVHIADLQRNIQEMLAGAES